jgi:hypothetical protein
MSDSVSSVPAVGGPPMMFEIPPVTPVVGKPVPPSSETSEPTRAATPKGVGQRVDIFV